ncbi:CDP-alcohol phosphatidyltransferase family protein [Ruania suaedae]|uniref:CDP-alcohol phosphatidyltransferase family protein n=1 Tax=Ruania suaedae TaxID=2897774 RepID=UPI001E414E2F|nr:CDP-alcohol phosphatidyltransferase family protein [Ruania suaedae]UFU02736.1 CDP-alcohol phosphatidyltransferase family protein [Ruania suaedae]
MRAVGIGALATALAVVPVRFAAPAVPAPALLVALVAAALVPLTALAVVRRRTNRGHHLPGDEVTLLRAGLVGACAGQAGLVLLGELSPQIWPLFVLALVAWLLDGLDGIVARRTGTASEAGGRFDVEIDAVLLLALSAVVATVVGWWVLGIGMLRYLWVLTLLAAPRLDRPLAPRPSRRRIAGLQGGVLVASLAPSVPDGVVWPACALALALLCFSFARDGVHAQRTQPS